MVKFLVKIFMSLWPKNKKEIRTDAGHFLRCCMLVATVTNCLMYFVCIAIVGFLPMLLSILKAAWAYSCYLTLREREIAVYFIFLVASLVCSLWTIFDDDKKGNVQVLGHLINIAINFLLGMYIAKAWYTFRKSGGLHGK